MVQLDFSEERSGSTDPLDERDLKALAKVERVSYELFLRAIKAGRIVVLKNIRHKIQPLAIGENLTVKVNTNIGTSPLVSDFQAELKKVETALNYNTDTIMDLSTGGSEEELRHFQERILREFSIPVGTVPIYEAAIKMHSKNKAIIEMTEDDFFSVVEQHVKRGVDFLTIHAGIHKNLVDQLVSHPRLMGVVSRGGTFTIAWMLHHGRENPYFAQFDYLLELLAETNVAISLGDGFRPGSIFDANDYYQLQELLAIAKLVRRCQERGVQVIVEGPGHVPADKIWSSVRIQKDLCNGAPFYVLGPIVTDIAPGYDEITGAIGGTIAGLAGADFLCYLTPAEHLGLPTQDDVKRGVIAARIAAHAVNLARQNPKALEWDRELNLARKKLDWVQMQSLAIDLEAVKERAGQSKQSEGCSMCGHFCAIKLLEEYLDSTRRKKKP